MKAPSPKPRGRRWAKSESEIATASVKDRVAHALIEDAEATRSASSGARSRVRHQNGVLPLADGTSLPPATMVAAVAHKEYSRVVRRPQLLQPT
jgi:hypothetical protein